LSFYQQDASHDPDSTDYYTYHTIFPLTPSLIPPSMRRWREKTHTAQTPPSSSPPPSSNQAESNLTLTPNIPQLSNNPLYPSLHLSTFFFSPSESRKAGMKDERIATVWISDVRFRYFWRMGRERG
jgi:hypothetical protein